MGALLRVELIRSTAKTKSRNAWAIATVGMTIAICGLSGYTQAHCPNEKEENPAPACLPEGQSSYTTCENYGPTACEGTSQECNPTPPETSVKGTYPLTVPKDCEGNNTGWCCKWASQDAVCYSISTCKLNADDDTCTTAQSCLFVFTTRGRLYDVQAAAKEFTIN